MDVLIKQEKRDVKKILEKEEVIEREATLSWDGTNLLLRLPKEIADYLNVNKENRFEKSILFKIREKTDGSIEKTFQIIKRTKKRKYGKKKTLNKK